jgi:hypothetical protein
VRRTRQGRWTSDEATHGARERLSGQQAHVDYVRAADFDTIDRDWDETDDTLLALDQLAEAFRGYTKWSLLRTEHYRVLIQRTMIVLESLSMEERQDPTTMSSRRSTRCSSDGQENRGEHRLDIEFMRIHRMTVKDIVFDYAAP